MRLEAGKGNWCFGGEGKEKGEAGRLKTLMVTIETEMPRTKSHTPTGRRKNHAFTRTKMYIHDKKKKKKKTPTGQHIHAGGTDSETIADG